jgi:hypothetical protein
LVILKPKSKEVNLLKETAEIVTGKAEKVQLEPGKQTEKTWFGLEI